MGREKDPDKIRHVSLGPPEETQSAEKLVGNCSLFNPGFSPVSCLGLKFEALVVVEAAEVGLTGSTCCPVGVSAGKAC